MEAEFMNQVNKLTMQFNEKEETLQKSLAVKDKQVTTLESRVLSAENRIRERDGQLGKLKEETTFQRHAIADLKNQLYQLQHEIEDAEFDKRDEVDKWSVEKKEMERQMELLRSEAQSPRDGGVSVMQNWKQLEEAKEALTETKARLHETQSSLASLENERKRAIKEHEDREAELLRKVDACQNGEGNASQQLRNELADRDKTISSLRDDIEKYSRQVAEMTVEMGEIKAEAHTGDKYRKEEAEDLRVLNQSLQRDIDRLKSDVDDAERELDEKDEALLDKNTEIESLREELDNVSSMLKESKNGAASSDQKRSKHLEQQLEESRNECEEVRADMTMVSQKFTRQIDTLQKEVHELTSSRDDLESKLSSAEDARDQARRSLEEWRQNLSQTETRTEQRLRDIVTKAAKEKDDIETEFNERLKSVEESHKRKIQQLSGNTTETQTLRSEVKQKTLEIERTRTELRQAQHEVEALKEGSSGEMEALREQIRVFELKKASSERAKKQLREAQIALVALDDEKTLSDTKLKKEIASSQGQKEELERKMNAQLLQKEAELRKLRESASQHNEFAAEIDKLKGELREKEAVITRETKSRSMNAIDARGGDPVLRQQLSTVKDSEEKLRKSLHAARQEVVENKRKLREKLEDRDTTISALVKSSVTQEQKVSTMKAEVELLKKKLENSKSGGSSTPELEAVRRRREAEYLDEIERLNTSLDASKAVENRLVHSASSLERKLVELEAENRRLQDRMNSDASGRALSPLSDHQEKLQERDSAIATLVKQSMALEQQVAALKTENSSLKTENEGRSNDAKNFAGPSWAEVRRLQKESEIFAGQIIEQDEEMESLRSAVEERDSRIASMEREVSTLKRKASSRAVSANRVEDLQAELDELQEANNTQRSELRDMRKQLRETKATANEAMDLRAELEQANHALAQMKNKVGSSAREDAEMKRQLEAVQLEKEEAERKANLQLDSMRRQRNSTVEAMEEKLRERDATIKRLENNDRLELLEVEIKKLSKELFEKSKMLEDSQKASKELQIKLEEQRSIDEMAKNDHEKVKLEEEVGALRRQLGEVESDKNKIDSIKQQLEDANTEKEALEQRIVDSYERKMSLLKLDKDVTIDGLRKDLADAKAVTSESNEDMKKHLDALERENKDVRDEFEAKMQLKNTKIYALEQTLGAQEQLVESMRAEMDQLQSSMERTSLSRRAEIEEMQQEMIDTSSKAQRQEREITSLKMTLEESRLDHKAEATKLKEQLKHMEQPPAVREVTNQSNAKLDDYKERLENLKWRNSTLQEENLKLRTRLEKVDESTRSDQETSTALHQEVTRLRKQVKDIEEKATVVVPTPQLPRPAPKPPTGDSGSSRFSMSRMASPARKREKTPSVGRKGQPSPLRFLKRRSQSKDVTSEEIAKASTEDSSSAASKMTF